MGNLSIKTHLSVSRWKNVESSSACNVPLSISPIGKLLLTPLKPSSNAPSPALWMLSYLVSTACLSSGAGSLGRWQVGAPSSYSSPNSLYMFTERETLAWLQVPLKDLGEPCPSLSLGTCLGRLDCVQEGRQVPAMPKAKTPTESLLLHPQNRPPIGTFQS